MVRKISLTFHYLAHQKVRCSMEEGREEISCKDSNTEDARRCSAATKKCRCDKAIVLDITSLDGETHFDEVVNHNYKVTTYKVGEVVYPDSFDEDRWIECSRGIHFFVNKKDAIDY